MRNLTEVSLTNKTLIWYFIIITALGGVFSYGKLGRMEDPDFPIRQMVVSVAWPGATAKQMEEQVTDKLEKKLQDTPGLDFIRSESRPGTAIIFVKLADDRVEKKDIRPIWRDVRNFCEDVKRELPEGVRGPYYNDRFDDVFGSVYAMTGDGFSYEEMRREAEKTRRILVGVPDVQKVELIGEQPEKVYVEVENSKLAGLGIPPQAIENTLRAQNQMTPAGKVETASDNVYLRVTGIFDDVEAIRDTPITANGKVFRLGDIASVERRFVDPEEPKMFFNGEPAIGIAVSMREGGNILSLGQNLREQIRRVQDDLPLGLEIHQVSDQPQAVDNSIHDFVKTLMEAIVIVLAVSFFSLGFRTGLVVAGCIPLVLAGVFVAMYLLGIDLHKVSLGALIISLGLLVDDAIIAVEMMSVQLERGLSRFDAACYAFRATAKPMLTGTLITCAGFIPVAFSKDIASEFCGDLFPVIACALVFSWVVSVMVAPLYGYSLIRVRGGGAGNEPKESRFYLWFRRILKWFLRHRKTVLAGTAVVFGVSLWGMGHIRQEFFPPSLRPEIIVEMRLPQGSSMEASQSEADRMAAFLDAHKEDMENYSSYVGVGAPRFVLTLEPVLQQDNFAQFVIVAKDTAARERLTAALREALDKEFSHVRSSIKFIQTGPPADAPVMLRVSGYDADKVRAIAGKVSDRVARDENNYNVFMDWHEKSKILHLELDQDKLRALGISSQAVAQMLYTEITGATAAQFYAGDRTIGIDLRMAAGDRQDISRLKNLPVYLGAAGYVPLEQIAKISFDAEDGLIKRRNLKPTITVQAEIQSGTPNDATARAYDAVKDIREELPPGYSIEPGGAWEDSKRSASHLLQPVPAMVLIIITLLMFQLGNGKDMLLTLATAPLGLIGVAWGMLLTGKSIGFVAELGILALFGMIIRNSVILIDQIQKHIESGETPWDAIVDSAVLRFRPIMLTAVAAILGMLPLMPSTFWGPMAVAIAGGLLAATVLTLLVLPVMYAVAYRIEEKK